MSEAVAAAVPAGEDRVRVLPRRDLYLLPALSLATIIVILSIGEIACRIVWPDSDRDSCRTAAPTQGWRFRPNCQSKVKVAESGWVQNSYNDCGFRTKESCGSKPPGTIRVAVLGSSSSYGYMTPYESAYTTILGNDLSRRCGRHVEFQNTGAPNMDMIDIYHRMGDALAMKPDLILLAVNPYDVRKDLRSGALEHRDDPVDMKKHLPPLQRDHGALKILISNPLKESRFFSMIQHFVFQDPDTYAKLYLLYGDPAGYLRPNLSPEWQKRFSDFDVIVGELAQRSHNASIPMVVFIGPAASQVAILDTPPRENADAYAFSRRVSALAARHQLPVVDPLDAMTGQAHPMSLFYVLDGHVAPSGQAILARVLERQLLSGDYPAFAGCTAN